MVLLACPALATTLYEHTHAGSTSAAIKKRKKTLEFVTASNMYLHIGSWLAAMTLIPKGAMYLQVGETAKTFWMCPKSLFATDVADPINMLACPVALLFTATLWPIGYNYIICEHMGGVLKFLFGCEPKSAAVRCKDAPDSGQGDVM